MVDPFVRRVESVIGNETHLPVCFSPLWNLWLGCQVIGISKGRGIYTIEYLYAGRLVLGRVLQATLPGLHLLGCDRRRWVTLPRILPCDGGATPGTIPTLDGSE